MKIPSLLRRSFAVSALALFAALPASTQLRAQSAAAPAEGQLTSFMSRDPKDVGGQISLLTQEVYGLKTELIASNFQLEYAGRIRMQRIWFASNTADKATIPASIFTPAKLVAGKKYPALVFVHGGAHIQLTQEWFPWIEEAVQRGYVVIYPEYRGSSGQGETIFENNYGVTDLADVLAATAYFAGKDYVDPARLGIFAHSRGGMVELRALEVEPKRFKVAVGIAGLSDLVSFMGYKTEARRQDIASQKNYGGKLPDKNLPAYIGVSPAFFVDKIETPILLLSTTGDATVPYQLHNKRVIEALKAYGKTYDEHLYELAPGGHEFAFADTEEGRDAMKRTFDWFAKYLSP